MPRPRPPFPASQRPVRQADDHQQRGDPGQRAASLLATGAEWFAAVGTKSSKGTKVFALSGKVTPHRPGGSAHGHHAPRQIVFDVGGGIPNGKKFKAVQIGGPSGGCIPEQHLDIDIDYESLKSVGAMMGSGGLVVHGRGDLHGGRGQVLHGLHPARELRQVHPLPGRHAADAGDPPAHHPRPEAERGASTPWSASRACCTCRAWRETIRETSLCGLGQTAPNPVLTTLRWFRDEYEAHIYERHCPAGACTELVTYTIDPEKCKGCTLCRKKCPTEAIMGAPKTPHYIITEKCVSCGNCMDFAG